MEYGDSASTNADAQKQITALREEMEQIIAPLRERINQTISNGLTKVVNIFFEQFPEVKTVYWQQYIPTWNDGEECTFSLNEVHFSPADHERIDYPNWGDDQDDDELADFSSYGNKNLSPELVKAMDQFVLFLMSIEDHLEDRYGSNAFIKLHRGGDSFKEIEPPY